VRHTYRTKEIKNFSFKCQIDNLHEHTFHLLAPSLASNECPTHSSLQIHSHPSSSFSFPFFNLQDPPLISHLHSSIDEANHSTTKTFKTINYTQRDVTHSMPYQTQQTPQINNGASLELIPTQYLIPTRRRNYPKIIFLIF